MPAEPEKTHLAKELKYGKPLVSCRFDPSGRYVFAGSEDDTAQRWDLKDDPAKAKPAAFDAHDGWVFALALSRDGQTLLTGGTDGKLIWWPATSTAAKIAPVRTVPAHKGWLRDINVSPDGKQLATCGNDHKVRIWSLADGKPLLDLPGHSKPVYRVMFTADGLHLLSADLMGTVIQWDARTGKEARRFDAAKLHLYEGGQGVDYGGVRDISLAKDGSFLACSGLINASNPLGAVSNPAVLFFDWKTGKPGKLQHPKEDVKGVGWGVRFHPQGFVIMASGGTGGGFLFFSKPDQENEFSKFTLPNSARAMDLHPDGVQVATAHHDGILRVSAMKPKA
ncbi:MAG: WD40 repeat domain-containing protein [Isosphaeraceae bacterium]